VPRMTRLSPYRPVWPGWHWHLGDRRLVAERFTGPEPSAPLWILLRGDYMKAARIGQAVVASQFKQIRRTTPRVSTSRAGPRRR
jgi:hypothetical protein